MNIEMTAKPTEYSKWGFPGTLIWGVIIAIAFVVTQIAAMAVYINVFYKDVTLNEYQNLLVELQSNGTVLAAATFSTLIICGTMIFGIIKLKRNSNIVEYLGFKAVGRKVVIFWFLIIVAVVILSDAITLLMGRPLVPEFMSLIYASTESKWLLWLALIVAAPLFEEIFFRGFLFSGFSSSFLGPVSTISITSLLWALIHLQYDLYGLITVFVIGLVLGFARYKSNSIVLTMGMHALMNLIATIETAAYI